MKLVNIEDLKVLVAVESKGEIRYGKLVTDLFGDIPAVEAIPIEWIEKWVKTEPLGVDSLIEPEYTIKAMLNEWGKENVTN